MLKILGFFVGALFTVWAFNKFVPSDTREEILETTDSVIVATANKIEQADLGEIVEQGTNVIQEAASTVGHKVDNANIGEIVDQGTDILQNVATSVGDKVESLQTQNGDEKDSVQTIDGAEQAEALDEMVEQLPIPVTLIVSIEFSNKNSAGNVLSKLIKKDELAGMSLKTVEVGNVQNYAIALTAPSRQEAMQQWETFKAHSGGVALEDGPIEID